jgi:hypothetical protein
MSPGQTPSAPAPMRRMRRRKSSRRYLYFSAVLCALLLISIPLGHDYYLRLERSRALDVKPSDKTFDLVLSEVGFRAEDGKTIIAGAVKNESTKTYRNIQILLLLRNATGAVVGTIPVDIKELKAGSSAEFRTAQLPEGTARFSVRDLSGTPQ